MCKPVVINRRVVWRIIRDSDVTGRDLHRCAVCIVAELGAHPACVNKVEGILEDLVRQGRIQLRDAMLRCVDVAMAAAARRSKFDRAAARREGKIASRLATNLAQLDESSPLPPAWRDCDPEAYASSPLSPAGGWEDDDASDAAARVLEEARQREIKQLMSEQFMDWRREHFGFTEESDLVNA